MSAQKPQEIVEAPAAATTEDGAAGQHQGTIILHCFHSRNHNEWRVKKEPWVFRADTLEAVQKKALEIYPKAFFLVHFSKNKKGRRT